MVGSGRPIGGNGRPMCGSGKPIDGVGMSLVKPPRDCAAAAEAVIASTRAIKTARMWLSPL